jgi:hypothetical protein
MNWTVSQTKVFPIAFGVVILIAFVLGILLRNKSNKIKNTPFVIIAAILLIAEAIKQIRAFEAGYNNWSIPLHYCSMFLLWFSMASFFNGKVKRAGHAISYVTGFAFLIGFLIGPSTIIGNATDNLTFAWNNFGSIHTFYYHFGIVLFFALQITMRIPFPTLKNLKEVAIPFFSWMAFASIIANLTNTNFSNLLYNNIGFMQQIQEKLGYVPYLLMMFLTFFTLCVGILTLGSLLNIIKLKLNKNK